MQIPSSFAEFVFSGKLQALAPGQLVCVTFRVPCVPETFPCAVTDAVGMGLVNVETMKM